MYFVPVYPYPYYPSVPSQDYRGMPFYQTPQGVYENNSKPMESPEQTDHGMNMQVAARAGADMHMPAGQRQTMDYGSRPYVVNINEAVNRNNTFRTVIWTGNHLQVVVMRIEPGDDIGLEVHPNHDQFLRVEAGEGITRMGDSEYNLDFEARISRGSAVMVPAGKWHNIMNTGNQPLKLYTIYAPPEHDNGTVHETKQAAMASEETHF